MVICSAVSLGHRNTARLYLSDCAQCHKGVDGQHITHASCQPSSSPSAGCVKISLSQQRSQSRSASRVRMNRLRNKIMMAVSRYCLCSVHRLHVAHKRCKLEVRLTTGHLQRWSVGRGRWCHGAGLWSILRPPPIGQTPRLCRP